MENITQKQLQKLQRSDEFDALVKLYGEIIDKWQSQNVIGQDEFETLKLLFIQVGKIAGLREFFEVLEGKYD